MELSGEYDTVISKLGTGGRSRPPLGYVTADFEHILDTVDAIDDGTKSRDRRKFAKRHGRTLGFSTLIASAIVIRATMLVPFTPLLLLAWFIILGLVLWSALPARNVITSQYSEQEFSGSLFGIMLTAGSLGGAAVPLLFGVAAEQFGLGTAFSLISCVSILGALAFLVLVSV